MAKLFLIDGNSYIYRAFFAIKGLRTSSGFPTNAVYGFTSMLLKLTRGEKPGYMAVAFDLPAPTFRHRLFSGYKETRPPMPEELKEQFPVIREIISAFGVASFEMEGYEADDIIATIAVKNASAGLKVFIFSQDKDCLQLVGENTTVLKENKSVVEYDREAVIAKWGVGPEKLVDVMSLCGDSSDNIPGARGVGVKTAVKLIRKFGSAEGVVAGIDKIENEKLRESIVNFKDTLMLNRELVRLNPEVPVDAGLEAMELREPRKDKLEEMFSRLEFYKFVEKV